MKLRNILAVILIIGGIIFMLLPPVKNKLIEGKVKKTAEAFENSSAEEIKQNNEKKGDFDFEDVEEIDALSALDTSEMPEGSVVAMLKIPSLEMEIPILKGTTNENLNQGATTMREDQILGKGNYPVAGHWMKDPKLLFGNLMNIEDGADVYVSDKVNIYHYKIYKTEIVPDTSVHLIEDEEAEKRGNPIISLMTCNITSKSGERFFAYGDLLDIEREDENKEK